MITGHAVSRTVAIRIQHPQPWFDSAPQNALAEPKSHAREAGHDEDDETGSHQSAQDRAWLRERLLASDHTHHRSVDSRQRHQRAAPDFSKRILGTRFFL